MDSLVTITMNPALDLAASVDRASPNEKLRTGRVRRDPGGGGLNVARVAVEPGGRPTAVYLAGGATGELLDRALEDHGIARHRIGIGGCTREDLTVTDESSGGQYRFVMPGPEVDADDCERALEAAVQSRGSGWVVASGSLSPGAPATLPGRTG